MSKNGARRKESNNVRDKISKRHVQSMVRKVVGQLELLHDGLNDVISDINNLVHDIEKVTDKVETEFQHKGGNFEACDSTNGRNTTSKVSGTIELDKIKVDYGNIIKCNTLGIEFNHTDESPDLDLSYLEINPGLQRPRWGRSLSTPISIKNTPTSRTEIRSSLNATSFIRDAEHEFLYLQPQPVARCFAQIKRDDNTRKTVLPVSFQGFGNESVKSSESVGSDSTYKEIVPRNFVNSEAKSIKTELTKEKMCSCQKKYMSTSINGLRPNVEELYTTVYPEVFEAEDTCGARDGITLNGARVVPSLSTSSSEVAENDGSYENDMENLAEVTSQSGLSDCDMEQENTGNTPSSHSDLEEIPFDNDVTTWEAYALTQVSNSTKSSDSFSSETPSDILNDNTKATAVYGNMIFSDNLVIFPSKLKKKNYTTF